MQEYADLLQDSLAGVADDLEQEFERLLVESSTLAFRVAYSVLRQREDAEDVAQEAFVKAHRNFRKLRTSTSFRAWLVRITWRLAIDRQRANRRRANRDQEHGRLAAAASSVDSLLMNERAKLVWRAIDALPEKLRLTIVLAGIDGHDIREIAQLLKLPEGTVKSRLFLARERMKESLRCINGPAR
jgi:RNA polymerase sigma-70 factor (ECF subfamily)